MSSYPPPPDAPDALPGVNAPDDTALAERLWHAYRRDSGIVGEPGPLSGLTQEHRAMWLRVAAEARAALEAPAGRAARLAAEGDAMRNIAIAARAGKTDPAAALRAILAISRCCRSCGGAVEPMRQCYAIPTCYACLAPPPPLPILDPGARLAAAAPRRLTPHRQRLAAEGFCMADDDGDCTWEGCEQNDPKTRKPHCLRDIATRRRLDPNDEGRAGNG